MNILYLAHEIAPFLSESPISSTVRTLAQHATHQQQDTRVRVMVPRFKCIQQRKYRIHEVLRLSGINISLGKEELSLLVQVSSVRDLKLQVYFMDNEDLFNQKHVFYDTQGTFYPNNGALSIFFCRAALATIAQLEWKTDLVHCHGWFSAPALLYLKTIYKRHPIFRRAKTVQTLYPGDPFDHTFGTDFLTQLRGSQVKEKHLAAMDKPDFQGLINLGAAHADLVTRTFEADPQYPSSWLDALQATYIPQDDQEATHYYQHYQALSKRR